MYVQPIELTEDNLPALNCHHKRRAVDLYKEANANRQQQVILIDRCTNCAKYVRAYLLAHEIPTNVIANCNTTQLEELYLAVLITLDKND